MHLKIQAKRCMIARLQHSPWSTGKNGCRVNQGSPLVRQYTVDQV